jgi:hypothetical protein
VRVCFYYAEKPRERILREAFGAGVKSHGDEFEARLTGGEIADCDVAVMVGVKSRELFQSHWRAGIHTVLVDKGYYRAALPGGARGWLYWRVAVNAHQCTHYLSQNRPGDRAEKVGWSVPKWRRDGRHVLFAGSSQKYHEFVGAGSATGYAEKIIKRLGKYTTRPIVYRPKPSWDDAVAVEGADFHHDGVMLGESLRDCWAMVTHGSSASVEAILSGVPVIVTGDAVAKPISSTDIAQVESPRMASYEERWQWLSDLAYNQWTLHEFASGEAWQHIRPVIYGPN